jgi:hypothetical protein
MTDLGEALALWLYEHGVKEDISGNSVRALWLDGPLPGARPEVHTSGSDRAPNTPSNQSSVPTVVASLRALSRVKLRFLHYRRRVSRRMRSLAIGLVCLLAGVLVTLAFTRGSSPEVVTPTPPVEPAPLAAAAVPAPEPAPLAVKKVVDTEQPAPTASGAEAAPPSVPVDATTRKREAVVAPRASRKTIKNFGF